MSDELTVSVGGGTRVAVDELFAEAAALGALEGACLDWADRAEAIRNGLQCSGVADAPGAAASWGRARGLSQAGSIFSQAARETGAMRESLVVSAERYGQAERTVTAMWEAGVRYAGANAGLFALVALPFLIGPGLAAGRALAQAAANGAWSPKATARTLLSDPRFVRLVRAAGGSVDELLLGLRGVPAPIAMLIGAGLGAPENASLLLGAAGGLGFFGSRVLVDRAVTVGRAPVPGGDRVPPPASVGDLARRVPSPDAGGAQVRVERYGSQAASRWVVYIGGTMDFLPVAGDEPFDLTSDLHAVADGSRLDGFRVSGAEAGAAERAVRQALAEAGARPGDPILPVGHSAGGMITAALARDPELDVVAAVNLGGPVANMDLGDVRVLSIEHVDDLVPALGGPPHPSPGLTTVTREALPGAATGEDLLPAHALSRYRETAELVDRSKAPELAGFGDLIRDFAGEDPGTRSDWRATRVSPGVSSGEGAR
ncbi:alpha/beta fold hydrolase [Agromyces aerolatus]|uniref:hypothetical protein n=1 Tax=Agromyces sp. LY-1074 TaxID=3074080 RepID=UPI0028550219|nr:MULTISPECIES: hypothetical protein [unclassified Agromyces]MDR5699346.1 hypothetical protein [Agromyces sp. LY-1074]MDR5705642.1 hypothetical protein [Agromyces sp. LY-1358]